MKKIIILTLAFLLSGCSTKFVYNNSDWLIDWVVGDYVDLNEPQEFLFDQKFRTLLDWHKRHELSKYARHLEELIADIEKENINPDKVSSHQTRFRNHWKRLREKAAPSIADIAAELDDRQINTLLTSLSKKLNDDIKEWQKRQGNSAQEAQKNWLKHNRKHIKRWIGKIDHEQEKLFIDAYSQFSPTHIMWFDYRTDVLQAIASTFELANRNELFKAKIRELVTQPESLQSEEFTQRRYQNQRILKLLILDLFPTLTPKQKAHLVKKLSDLRDDIIDIQNSK